MDKTFSSDSTKLELTRLTTNSKNNTTYLLKEESYQPTMPLYPPALRLTLYSTRTTNYDPSTTLNNILTLAATCPRFLQLKKWRQ